MRVATVTCREEAFPIERDQLNNVNDLAGSWCFGSRAHIPLKESTRALRDYDAVWFTMSKQIRPYEGNWMDLLSAFKVRWPQKKVILHQEGEAEFYLMRPSTAWDVQRGWMEVLYDKVDLLLTHNARETGIFKFFVEAGEVETWRTVQDVYKMEKYLKAPEDKEKTVGISTYDGRANGVLGISVASKVTNNITQVTRSLYSDNRQGFIHKRFGVDPHVTTQCGWYEWLEQLSKVYIYLHPMPAASAGRDTIACAALGIPVVGNKHLDAQMHLFPELAVDPYDSRKMEELVTELLYSHDLKERTSSIGEKVEAGMFTSLYDRARNYGLKHYKHYDIDNGVIRATKIMEGLGWK